MKQKFSSALSLALIMAMLFTSVGLADNVKNDVVAGGNDTITAGGSTTINYQIQAIPNDDQTGGGNCNANDGSAATVTINTPAGVTVDTSGSPGNQVTLTFTSCGTNQSAVFSSNTPGDYGITVSVSDSGAGTYNTSPATFTLKVNAPANTTPSLNLPGPITAEATGPSGATVSYAVSAPDAEDNPDPTPACSPASGATFPLGSTTVNCSVADSGGLTANGSFSVTVKDTTAPALTLPVSPTVEATGATGAVVSYTVSANDLVDGAVAVSCSPVSGSTFGFGSTTVNCSASDSRSNLATESFTVTVQDTTAPVLVLPDDITAEATSSSGAMVNYTASASDLVDGPVSVSCEPSSGSTFALGTTSVNCSATDGHSNTANDSFNVTVQDTTAPVIEDHDDVTAEATGPGGAIVTYDSPATSDAVDGTGVASCLPASGSQFPIGETDVTCNASDDAGNNAVPLTFTVHVVDTTDPIITYVTRTAANSNGWNNGDVTVTWSCTDIVEVVEEEVSETVSTEGENQSATGTCVDTSGNDASNTQIGINIDKTVPIASAAAAPAPNANGWNKTDVIVSFSGNDGLSGIDFCSDDVVVSSEAAGQSASGTCTDKAGNVSDSATASGINVDKTAPTILGAASPAGNSHGWNNTDVTVSFTCSDTLSGVASCGSNQTLTGEGAGQSATGNALDKADNSASTTVSGINIDKTTPSVALVGGPANGGSYYFGSVPAEPTCSASDALSGVNGTCSVSGYSNAVGTHTVTAMATDNADNTASASATYTVLAWTLNGFYAPVDRGIHNTVKAGVTVPLKFEVFAGSTELSSITTILSFTQTRVQCDGTLPEDAVEITSTGGTTLRYDATAGQFIQNWQTPKQAGACFLVKMTTQDGSFLTALFKLK
jgi:hypothetical protein